MHLDHLGLPVRDEQRGQQLYSAYFGFDPATAQKYPDGTVIIRNADGFDLSLHPLLDQQPGILQDTEGMRDLVSGSPTHH